MEITEWPQGITGTTPVTPEAYQDIHNGTLSATWLMASPWYSEATSDAPWNTPDDSEQQGVQG